MNDDDRTVWCGNISDKVTEELLYELFLQVAPLEKVRLINEKESRKPNIAFVTMKHEISVNYVIQLLDGINLFERKLHVKRRNSSNQNNHQQSSRGAAIQPNNEQQFLVDKLPELVYMSHLLSRSILTAQIDHRQDKYSNNGQDKYSNNGRQRGDDYRQQRHYNNSNNRYDNHNSGSYGRNNHNRHNNHQRNYDRRHRPY